ncbi:stage II sporulation protein M [Bacillus thuringiensis]|uniref:stage II sporulation protein M n=1 Tax=Bacillus TaxID=1386 RepID=UPI0008F10B77|nr:MULTISPECIES: stage II sporulation protein M [Bacillus]PGK78017.1 stage II sporulation protein M [Bacillus thuringiensis]PGL19550.1 stage II sporulation protein M [Bacillus thuringiensis]SFL89031.1 Stage II sporulation protein M [Bacillus sp. 5mfcol3.1]
MKPKLFILCFIACSVIGSLFFFLGFLLLPNEQFSPNLKPSFITIFSNNLEIHLFTIIFSIISFGFFSLIFLFEQFFYLGFSFHSLIERTSLKTAASYFAGHGIIEIINMFFTATIGVYVAVSIINIIRKKELSKNSFIILGKKILILLVIDLVLLFVAALLETYLSPLLVDRSYII